MGCKVCGDKVKARGLCMNHYAQYRRGSLKIDAPTVKTYSRVERFVKYTKRVGSCWLWTGALDSKGYGRVGNTSAHRWSYRLFVGCIPEDMDLDHICHNRDLMCKGGSTCQHRRCVNPRHLLPTTRKNNLSNGNGFGGNKYRHKSHCVNGHDISSDDAVYLNKNQSGGISRRCKVCARKSNQESARKRHGNAT